MFSSTRKRIIGCLVAALVASCAPFASSTGDDAGQGGPGAEGGSGDGGASGEGSASDAHENPPPEASTTDAGFVTQDGGFCGGFKDAIDCFDFDESNPPARLTLSQSAGGTNTFGPTFAGGSAPTALVVKAPSAGANAVATVIPIAFPAHTKKLVTIDFQFSASAAATGAQNIGRLGFTSQSFPISLSSANALQCGGVSVPFLNAGVHAIAISMAVDASGNVSQFTCTLDGTTSGTASVVPSKTLSLELGNTNSGAGSLTVTYDNVVVRAH